MRSLWSSPFRRGVFFLSALYAFCLVPGLGPDYGLECARAQTAVRGPAIPPPHESRPATTYSTPAPAASPAAAADRRDYEMGTDGGDSVIRMERDHDGDEVVRVRHRKKQRTQAYPFEDQPIQVRPIVPMGGSKSSGSGGGR